MKSYFTNTILLVFAYCCFGPCTATAQCDPACPSTGDPTQFVAYSYNPPGTTVYCEYDASGNCVGSIDLAPLPIELVYFKATPKSKTVILDWQTISEEDNQYFEILRSADGRSYQSVGIVEAAGNSQEAVNYQFVDSTPARGYNYYLLKQVDFDGTTNHSALESAYFQGAEDLVLLKQYVAHQQLYLQYQSILKGKFDLVIFDQLGRKIKHQVLQLEKGTNQVQVALPQKGMLFLSLTNGRQQWNHKLMAL